MVESAGTETDPSTLTSAPATSFRSQWKRWSESLQRPVDAGSVVVFRFWFGAIMLWEVFRYFKQHRIGRTYIEPQFFFKYYGFEWVHPWSGDGMYYHFVALGLLGLFMAIGLFYRTSAILMFLAFTHLFLIDQAQYLNHFYLVCLCSFLLIFVPANRAGALDSNASWVGIKQRILARLGLGRWARPSRRCEDVPLWSVWILRFQVGVAYFYGGVAKLNEDWLRGEPVGDWVRDRDHYPVIGPFLGSDAGMYFFAYGGLLYDLLVVPLLLWKKTRVAAFVATLFFHLTNAWLFSIGIFPWFMIGATTIFFVAHWPRRIPFLVGPRDANLPALRPPTPRAKTIIAILVTAWIAFQVLVPLRHFLYPGNVHWTEEGHRFSWHMKLRDKTARIQFILFDPETRRGERVKLHAFLTRRQMSKMAARPDMIIQVAHHLAAQAATEGRTVEVLAQANASLNDRHEQLLVNPRVDLGAEKRTLGHADWIVPLEARREDD